MHKLTVRCRTAGCQRTSASFTVEAAMLMGLILPVLLAILYFGFYLHDRGVLAGAACETSARADLGTWKASANSRIDKTAASLAKRIGSRKKVSSSVSVSKDAVDVSYQSSLTLPGALPQLFGHSSLDTGIAHRRTLIRPAEIIRKVRGLEYISKMLKKGDGQ